jgi:hypothetical protein
VQQMPILPGGLIPNLLLVYCCTSVLITSDTYLLVTGICFPFNCFVTGNKMTITDELAAADANQIWWFKTNPYCGSLPQPN